ncbi:MAG: hypothetical protein GEU90_18700, partial [Gemmatimonas sp.]|nr:hypothetical protein [Gemmatimonas sp.]
MSVEPSTPAAGAQEACPRCRELKEQNAALTKENRKLKIRLQRAERRAAAAERAGKRQAAPFSKGKPTHRPKRPGRRAGPDYGEPTRRRIPEHVDEIVEV